MIHQPRHLLDASQSGFRTLSGPVPREYFYHFPAGLHAGSPIIVSVHGISMNAAEHMVRLRGIAEQAGAAVIAPVFNRKVYPRYQQLADSRSGVRADLALIDMLADVRRQTGIATPRIHITGFSGGAQFAHRFALYHADQVASCVSCAAGWYSFPMADAPYPLGMGEGTGPGGASPHPAWRSVAHHVIVGARDNSADPALNMTEAVVALQGTGRRTRARRWVRAMNRDRRSHGLSPVTLTELPGLNHDFTQAHDRHDLAHLIATKMGLGPHKELRDA